MIHIGRFGVCGIMFGLVYLRIQRFFPFSVFIRQDEPNEFSRLKQVLPVAVNPGVVVHLVVMAM
jgi:branched-subunit amino acid transport protein AzlD